MKKFILLSDNILRFAVHAAAALFSLAALAPITLKPNARLVHDLLNGSDKSYVLPGSQFKVFKPYLPAQGRYSLILDRPNKESAKYKEASYDAQNFLAPLVINLQTEEPMALVDCTSVEIAEHRLAETGYIWVYPMAPGRGLAKKKVP